MTYTLLAIDRINGRRLRTYKTTPQSGLTMKQLDGIRNRELKKWYEKHTLMSERRKTNELHVFLLYRTDEPEKP